MQWWELFLYKAALVPTIRKRRPLRHARVGEGGGGQELVRIPILENSNLLNLQIKLNYQTYALDTPAKQNNLREKKIWFRACAW